MAAATPLKVGRALAPLVLAVLAALVCAPGAHAGILDGTAAYQVAITGTTFEAVNGVFQPQASVNNLGAALFVEPRRNGPTPTSPVVALTTGPSPVIDDRPGSVNFATNTQGFDRINAQFSAAINAAVDVARVQADPGAGTLQATVDQVLAPSVQIELFRVSSFIANAPAQILAGTMSLQFGPDGRTVTGTFEFGGRDHIEPGNPLYFVKAYTGTLTGQLTAFVPASTGQADTGNESNAPPPPPPPPPPAAVPTPTSALSVAGGLVTGGKVAAVAVTCTLDATCAGVLRLVAANSSTATGTPKKRKTPTVYGTARFSVPAHRTKTVHVRLNRAGKKLVKHRRKTKVVVQANVGGQVTSTRVTLTRAKKPKKQ
jgi:hypothetical protein